MDHQVRDFKNSNKLVVGPSSVKNRKNSPVDAAGHQRLLAANLESQSFFEAQAVENKNLTQNVSTQPSKDNVNGRNVESANEAKLYQSNLRDFSRRNLARCSQKGERFVVSEASTTMAEETVKSQSAESKVSAHDTVESLAKNCRSWQQAHDGAKTLTGAAETPLPLYLDSRGGGTTSASKYFVHQAVQTAMDYHDSAQFDHDLLGNYNPIQCGDTLLIDYYGDLPISSTATAHYPGCIEDVTTDRDHIYDSVANTVSAYYPYCIQTFTTDHIDNEHTLGHGTEQARGVEQGSSWTNVSTLEPCKHLNLCYHHAHYCDSALCRDCHQSCCHDHGVTAALLSPSHLSSSPQCSPLINTTVMDRKPNDFEVGPDDMEEQQGNHDENIDPTVALDAMGKQQHDEDSTESTQDHTHKAWPSFSAPSKSTAEPSSSTLADIGRRVAMQMALENDHYLPYLDESDRQQVITLKGMEMTTNSLSFNNTDQQIVDQNTLATQQLETSTGAITVPLPLMGMTSVTSTPYPSFIHRFQYRGRRSLIGNRWVNNHVQNRLYQQFHLGTVMPHRRNSVIGVSAVDSSGRQQPGGGQCNTSRF